MGRAITFAFLLAAACSESAPPSILLEITSPLVIPGEANGLVVRVNDGQTLLGEQPYVLGPMPRDRWPQTLPIVAAPTSPKTIKIALELQHTSSGAPTDVVGFAGVSAKFPDQGQSRVQIEIMPICRDPGGCTPRPDAGLGDGAFGDDSGVATCAGQCPGDQVCCGTECVPRCEAQTFMCADQDRICDPRCMGCSCTVPCASPVCDLRLFSCANGCCQIR